MNNSQEKKTHTTNVTDEKSSFDLIRCHQLSSSLSQLRFSFFFTFIVIVAVAFFLFCSNFNQRSSPAFALCLTLLCLAVCLHWKINETWRQNSKSSCLVNKQNKRDEHGESPAVHLTAELVHRWKCTTLNAFDLIWFL